SPRPPAISAHRFARYVVWVRLMVVWVAGLLAPLRASERHLRQRGWHACTHPLARLVRDLILLRTAQLSRRRHPPFAVRNHARPGFRRRMRVRQLLRAAAGARLRRTLRDRRPAQRLSLLLDALANIETHAARLVARARRGLTRLHPLTLVRALADPLPARPAPQPAAADSS
ncbi:MAG: hypothetical protein AB7F85_16500, partial [Hyphomonadaceae bacterium]